MNDELVEASTLNPADIAAYDREESEPFQGLSLKDLNINAVNRSNDTLSVSDLMNDRTLYVRYSQYACGDCIKFLNSAMKDYAASNPDVKIKLLLKDIDVRDIHVLEIKLDKRFDIFKVDSLPTDFDEAHTPYLFKMDKAKRVVDYYIPRKELPDSLDAYLYK